MSLSLEESGYVPQEVGLKPLSWAGWQGWAAADRPLQDLVGSSACWSRFLVQPPKRGAAGRQTRRPGREFKVMWKDDQGWGSTEPAAAAAAAKLLQSCPTLCDPIDCSPPGSPVPRILQARTLGRESVNQRSQGEPESGLSLDVKGKETATQLRACTRVRAFPSAGQPSSSSEPP